MTTPTAALSAPESAPVSDAPQTTPVEGKAAPAKAPAKKAAVKKAPDAPEFKFPTINQATQQALKTGEAVDTVPSFMLPLSAVTKNTNPRHEPEVLFSLGYVLVGDEKVEEVAEDETDPAKFVSLLHLALSDNIEHAEQYVDLIETNESVDRKTAPEAPQSIVELAEEIADLGQLVPVLARKDRNGYDLIDGSRRTAAILYLYCKSRIAHEADKSVKVHPPVVLATDTIDSASKIFRASLTVNLGRKNFTPLQEARIYQEILQQVNPETGKKYSQKEGAELCGVPIGTFRNRAALWMPYKPPVKDEKTGDIITPARGLTEADRNRLLTGEMTVTAASRKALGEQHSSPRNASPNGAPVKNRRKALTLPDMETLFDETSEKNKERRQAIAECMNIDFETACKESDARIAAEEKSEERNASKKTA